ncbi:biotin synthase BioB [Desulforhopalus vacuolatus]|nr:biotin synthase BioB [Desulforhopalus vacuolatus]
MGEKLVIQGTQNRKQEEAMYNQIRTMIEKGGRLEFDEALELARSAQGNADNLTSLLGVADMVRRHFHGNHFDLCSIINARSGKCSENCRFCAQSSHYDVEVESYRCVTEEETLALARENEAHHVGRFSLVTAGHHVSAEDLRTLFAPLCHTLMEKTSLALCASMGFLTPERAHLLKEMGISRYHCNLETCRDYFPKVCTTHTWEEKVETLGIAKEAGLSLCSGGIIGLGESLAQRLEMAFELREIGVDSVPINILMPIKGTPFEMMEPISREDALIAIAMFRLILPQAVIRIAGGRNHLGDEQEKLFLGGAGGAIVGNYLTTAGNGLVGDVAMFKRLGFVFN